jgi:hypothetical protein
MSPQESRGGASSEFLASAAVRSLRGERRDRLTVILQTPDLRYWIS